MFSEVEKKDEKEAASLWWWRRSKEKIASVVEDPVQPEVVWEQRVKDLEAERQLKAVTSPGFSFSSVGILFPYHLGVAQFLIENGNIKMSNPWEIVSNHVSYPVKFYGKVVTESDGKRHWIGGKDIKAVAYDVQIPGYKTKTTGNLRLWPTTVPSKDFDLPAFNTGEHIKACEPK